MSRLISSDKFFVTILSPYCLSCVLVVPANPIHRRVRVFIAAFRHEIEEIVSPDQNIEPPRVGGISVEDLAAFIFVKHTQPRHLVAYQLARSVVVKHLVLRFLLSL